MVETLVRYGDGPQAIYEEIKQRIITGELKGGSELKIMPLANDLGVSIVPVREAIRILAAEDLIILRTRRSPIVADICGHDLVEINSIRCLLEPMVLKDAVPRHTPESLEACVSLMESDRACSDLWQKVELNERIHLALLSPSAFGRAKSIISEQYVGLARLAHYMVVNHPDLVEPHHEEHEAILAAVKAADAALAGRLMGAHIERATGRAHELLSGTDADKGEQAAVSGKRVAR